jgi:hypothetical protein
MKLTAEQKQARFKQRKQEKRLKEIEAEKNQPKIKSILINIEWKKNRTWGYNPNATVKIEYKEPTGEYGGKYENPNIIYKCSGCGYDKESTVIADIFNDYLKYKLYEKESENPEGKNIPYGIYTGEYKYYSGGIGTNCYYRIAEYIGGKFEHISNGKTFDVFKYTDNN